MSADRYREWDAAYLLGALSPEERLEFEEHLAECAACRAAVAESAGVPGVLRRLDAATAVRIRDLPAAAPLEDEAPATVARIAGRIRRRRRIVAMAAAAAVVVALGGGIALGTTLPGSAPPSAAATTTELHPVGGSAVSASLTMASIAEGTRLDWHCDYPAGRDWSGSTAYRLVVQDSSGAWRTVATWSASGQQADGLSTVTSIRRQDIRAIEIRLPGATTALAAVRL
jgi:predicted anti-sigma-YlaC factor YlaD